MKSVCLQASPKNCFKYRLACTSRQPYVSCTGCQSADEWIWRYPPSSIVRWPAPLLCT